MFAVNGNRFGKTEVVIQIEKFFALCALRLVAAGLVKRKRVVVKIVTGGNHINAFAALL